MTNQWLNNNNLGLLKKADKIMIERKS